VKRTLKWNSAEVVGNTQTCTGIPPLANCVNLKKLTSRASVSSCQMNPRHEVAVIKWHIKDDKIYRI
jgi:hypothetical protein